MNPAAWNRIAALILEAALAGDEARVDALLQTMDESSLSLLDNALHAVSDKTEARRKILRRAR